LQTTPVVMMRKLLYSIILLVILPLDINAQETSLDYLFLLSLEELLKVKVIGSTLTPVSLKTVPSAVTVFTHKEIQSMGLDSLDELMNLVPGFQSYRSDQSSLQYPYSSRGRRIGGPTSEVLLILDGQRLHEPRANGNMGVMPKLPLKQIERVEFIRGPGSAIYGSNAMIGVINIISRSAVNEINVAYGSNNLKQAHILASSHSDSYSLDFYARAEADDGEFYRVQDSFTASPVQTDDPKELLDVNIKFGWQETKINYLHSQSESTNFYVLGKISNDFNRYNGQFDSLSVKQGFIWFSLNSFLWLSYIQSKFGFSSQLTAEGALADISNPPSSDALFGDVDFNDSSEVRVQWHNDWSINHESSLQFGIEQRKIEVPETIAANNFDLGQLASEDFPITFYDTLMATTVVEAAGSRNISGLYTQYQNQVLQGTHLTLGLRFDDFSGIGSQFSPRLSLVQDVNANHTLKLLYGKAFRAPSESELRLMNNPLVVGNPQLKAETVQTMDVIWLGSWTTTRASLGYFENHYKNSIVQIPSMDDTTVLHANQDESPSKGVEFEVTHELDENWFLRGGYTRLFEKPETSFREADQLGSIIINYAEYDWHVNLIATYHGTRLTPSVDGNSTTSLESYWVLFAKFAYLYTPELNINLTTKNILNKTYQTPSRDPSVVDGIPNRGRELLLGLQWRF